MKLPPGQKAAVLAAILAVAALGLYFMLVDPETSRLEKANKDLKKAQAELVALRRDASQEALDKLRKDKDDLTELDKENRKMLPAEDEMPDFIDRVQADAQTCGLDIKRFDRLNTENYDLYNTVPVRVNITGTTTDFIKFLRIYAGTERRIINIHELLVEKLPLDLGELKKKIAKPLDPTDKKAVAQTVKTADEMFNENVDVAQLARNESKVRATFVAYAFAWTGKPAPKVEGQQPSPKKKKKRT